MDTKTINQLLIILISHNQEYSWTQILFNSRGDPIDFEEDIAKIVSEGQEVNLILNTDDLILNAYPKEETEEEPSLTFTLENIKYKLFID